MTGAELRVISGQNMIDLTDDEVDECGRVEARGMTRHLAGVAAAQVCAAGFAAARHPRAARRVRLAVYLRGSAAAHAPRVRDCRTRWHPHHPRVFLLADRRAGRMLRCRRVRLARAGRGSLEARDRDRARKRTRLQRRHGRRSQPTAGATRSSGADKSSGIRRTLRSSAKRRTQTATRRFPPIASSTSTPRTASSAIRNPIWGADR